MSAPLKCDTFTPAFTGISSLNKNVLKEGGNHLELFLVNKFHLDLKNFKSVSDIQEWAEKEFSKLGNFSNDIYKKYYSRQLELSKTFVSEICASNTGESNPIKRLLVLNSHIQGLRYSRLIKEY